MADQDECVWCDRAWALLGLLAGAGLAYMAIDVLFDSVLTRSLTRTARLATVTDLHTAAEGE